MDVMAEEQKITIVKDGPYLVSGNVPLSEDALAPNEQGYMDFYKVKDYETGATYALCRCGASKKKPFCDGEHAKISFDGTETAGHEAYAKRARAYIGADIELLDDERCAYARLCHKRHGDAWDLTEEEKGGELEEEAIAASWHCPTGRLEHRNLETGEVYEQQYTPSIIALEDTEEGVSGPLFVRGGIPLYGSDGTKYEDRNRYALCRCGASSDKPFCDAAHVASKFSDDSPALEGEYGPRDDSFEEKPPM